MDRDTSGASQAVNEPIFTTAMLDLNDDCQSAILRFLPVNDLSAVASTCTQLNAIACDVYKRRLTTKHSFDFPLKHYRVDKNEFIEMFHDNVKRMLINFGHLMNEIDFAVHPNRTTRQFNNHVFANIVKFCRGDELQKLHLRQKVELPPELMARGMRLFQNIKSLHAEFGLDANLLDSLLSTCVRLEQLHLNSAVTATRLNQFSFPNLSEFTFTSAGTEHSRPGLEEFLLRHKSTIKKLRLTETLFFFDLATIWEMTALNEFEHCIYNPYYVRADYSGRNPLNLKKIIIHNFDNIVSRFMTDLAPNVGESLEHFECDGIPDTFVESLKQFRRLISLKIHVRDNQIEILQNLSNSNDTLTHLDLKLSDGIIDRPFTHTLSQFRNLRTLTIHSADCVFRDNAIDLLQRFHKITHFSCTFSNSNENLDNWLKGLGSPHTMQTIEIVNHSENVAIECYKILNRYHNLKALTIEASVDWAYTDILNAIGGLAQLEYLRIVFLRGCKWMGVRRLVERSPKLQKLQIEFQNRNFPFDLKIYNDFVTIYRSRGTKLIIEYIDHDTNRQLAIPSTILQVYGDLCRFVEIQITHDKEALS